MRTADSIPQAKVARTLFRQSKVRPQAVFGQIILAGGSWKSHATLTPLAKQDCPLWLQYD